MSDTQQDIISLIDFPDDFNLKSCLSIIKYNQTGIINNTKSNFYKKVMTASETCEKKVELIFPDKLWHENKLIIISEIMDRFGGVLVKANKTSHEVTIFIENKKDLPNNITGIILELWK